MARTQIEEAMFNVEWFEYPTRRFVMGSDEHLGEADDDEGPSRQVTVGRLEATRTPITVSQFAAFVDDTGFETLAEVEGSGFIGRFPDHELVQGASWRHPAGPSAPAALLGAFVSQVAWTDATAFCGWSNARLPTEAQWARMASDRTTRFQPDIGSWWEWCADYYDAIFHRDEQRVNPVGPFHGTKRVARGGAERLTERTAFYPDLGASDVTFRIVRPPSGTPSDPGARGGT